MRGLRRLLGLDEPQETRVFLFVAAFGVVIGVVYWFISYEVAGTVLLLAFGATNGALAVALVRAPGGRVVRERARRTEGAPDVDPDRRDVGGGSGTADVDRPFLDERGRLPGDSFAPFAIGLGAATAATGLIFGPAPVVVGLLPFLWGAFSWLRGAGAELDATEADDIAAARLAEIRAGSGATNLQAGHEDHRERTEPPATYRELPGPAYGTTNDRPTSSSSTPDPGSRRPA